MAQGKAQETVPGTVPVPDEKAQEMVPGKAPGTVREKAQENVPIYVEEDSPMEQGGTSVGIAYRVDPYCNQ
jgi:hypothetical protein